MSREIYKARMRELAEKYHIEICLTCYEPTEECKCEPVTAGKMMAVPDYRRIKEGLGAVRRP